VAERFVVRGVAVPGRLHATDLTIASGITAIMGPSGAGKSTVCAILSGALDPAAGQVSRNLRPARLPLFIASGDSLWPQATVIEHLRLAAPAGDDPRDLLEQLGLEHRQGAKPDQLSTGERERLAVARALASRAGLLVLDEPFAHVDGALAERCWTVLWERIAADGSDLVYTTHDPERVIGRADDVVGLAQGRVIWTGPATTLYRHPPDPVTAAILGPVNWFSLSEAAPLGLAAGCHRPENLLLRPAPDGPATVAESRCHGALTVTTVSVGGSRLSLRHRSPALAAGLRIAIHSALSLLVLLACGCADSEPALEPTAITTWMLPPVAGNQPAPRGIGQAADGGMLVLDTAGRILDHDRHGTLRRQWTMPLWEAGRPEGIVTLADGRMVVADTHYHRLVWFAADTGVVRLSGSEGDGPGQFRWPVGACSDGEGNLWISEYGGNDRLQQFAPDGRHLRSVGTFGTGPEQFQRPQSLVWSGDRLFVADTMNNRIQMVGPTGVFLGVLGGDHPPQLAFPYGITAMPDGTLMVAEYAAGRLTRLGRDGTVLGRHGGQGRGQGQLTTPWGCGVAGDGAVWVADTGNRRVVRLVVR
jgi:iron(III) transport system ATP-binding protein